MIEEKDVRVAMRDGVKIALRVYRPEGAGPFPALFAASPYRYDNNELPAQPMFLWRETGPVEWYVSQGYAYVHADVRGSGFSDGVYRFLDRKEQKDLYELIEWIGTQPWCNGKVGGIGQSYYAMTQWFMGIENPQHLACLGLYDGLNDPYRYMGYPAGIEGNFLPYWFNASVRVANLYPANRKHPRQVTYDMLLDVQKHPLYDDYWKDARRSSASTRSRCRCSRSASGRSKLFISMAISVAITPPKDQRSSPSPARRPRFPRRSTSPISSFTRNISCHSTTCI